MISEEERRIAEIMANVYADGGRFVLSPDGKRVGLRDTERRDLHEQVRENRRAILEVLAGDPIDGIGWGVRSYFFSKALDYIMAEVLKMDGEHAEQRAEKALYNSEYMKDLNHTHLNGSFVDFRAELLRLANRVIKYARSGKEEAPAFVAR